MTWLNSITAGSTVIVHIDVTPECVVRHVCLVKKVDPDFLHVEYGNGLNPFCRSTGKGKHNPKAYLMEATEDQVTLVNAMKSRRALLMRIQRVVMPTSRACSDSTFQTPLRIEDKVVDKICKKLKLSSIRALASLVNDCLKAEASASFKIKRDITFAELEFIWDNIKEVEKNYLNKEGFLFKDCD